MNSVRLLLVCCGLHAGTLIATADELVKFAGPTMGTTYTISVKGWPSHLARAELHHKIENCLEEINATFSTYRPQSELQRINVAEAETWVEVSPRMHFVLRAARRLAQETEGAFDITVEPLLELWGRGLGTTMKTAPKAEEIKQALQCVGNDVWELRDEPPAIRKLLPAVKMNMNAIVPGYAIDCLAELLDAHGATEYLIELGGEVRARGSGWEHVDGWWVALENPSIELSTSATIKVALQKQALATSGDYRQFHILDGQKYSHILDPRTGQLIPYCGLAVSVVAEDSLTADAWATAFCVWGAARGLQVANQRNMAVCFLLQTHEPTQFDRQISRCFHERFRRYISPVQLTDTGVDLPFTRNVAKLGGFSILLFFGVLCGYYVFRRSRKWL